MKFTKLMKLFFGGKIMVYFSVKNYAYKTLDKLWPFFSTISANLEPNGWGTKYPTLLNDLCDYSKVDIEKLLILNQEVVDVKSKLELLKIKDVYLDYDDLSKKLICEKEYLKDYPLLDYFKDDLGRNLAEILLSAVDDAIRLNVPIEIKTL